MAVLGEDNRDIRFPAGLDHLQDIPKDRQGNYSKIVLQIDGEDGSPFRIDRCLPFPVGFQFP